MKKIDDWNSLIFIHPVRNPSVGYNRIYPNCQSNLIGKGTSTDKIGIGRNYPILGIIFLSCWVGNGQGRS